MARLRTRRLWRSLCYSIAALCVLALVSGVLVFSSPSLLRTYGPAVVAAIKEPNKEASLAIYSRQQLATQLGVSHVSDGAAIAAWAEAQNDQQQRKNNLLFNGVLVWDYPTECRKTYIALHRWRHFAVVFEHNYCVEDDGHA